MNVRLFIKIFALIIIMVGLSPGVIEAYGQDGGSKELSIRLNRDFGYGLGGQIQGSFSYIVNGPDGLTRVEFILDDEVIGEDTEAPFRFQFDTGDYSTGTHRLRATGYTIEDQILQSETITRRFVPGNSVRYIVVVIVALVILARVVSYLLARSSKRSGVSSVSYGYLGGAVCKNCGHPFSIHWWSLRLGISRFDRCPNCRKWNFVQRASADALDAADEFTQEIDVEYGNPPDLTSSDDVEYRQRLDESRFDEN